LSTGQTILEHEHNHAEEHAHVHAHHSENKKSMTPWILFTIFVF